MTLSTALSSDWDTMDPERRDALIRKAVEAARALTDPTHPDHLAAVARVRKIEAAIRLQTQPLLDAIAETERITAADLAITINAGLYD